MQHGSPRALNITDPYSIRILTRKVDRATGYRTLGILCTPIRNRQNEVIAVAQLLNKREAEAFSAADERRLDEISDSLALAGNGDG
ncbi:MAG TPA: hypothetical protein VE263_05975 [Candidatus Angelobacter sp.]|nr:hypothetical protein [Candidatus Angelobacter sp.]